MVVQWHFECFAIQLDMSQLNISRDFKADGEHPFCFDSLVFSDEWARQQRRNKSPVNSDGGLLMMLIHKALLQVQVEYIELEDAASHQALKQKQLYNSR